MYSVSLAGRRSIPLCAARGNTNACQRNGCHFQHAGHRYRVQVRAHEAWNIDSNRYGKLKVTFPYSSRRIKLGDPSVSMAKEARTFKFLSVRARCTLPLSGYAIKLAAFPSPV